MMVFGRVSVGVLGIAVSFGVLSCGGSSPTAPAPQQPDTAPTAAAPTPTPATAAPTTAPLGAQSCPLGKGTLSAHCAEMASAYVNDVSTAIGELARKRADIFDLKDEPVSGQYRVVKTAEYLDGLVQQLQSMGFCAEHDRISDIQVKKGNEFSEKYRVVTSGGYVRRGEGSYRDSCRPAVFPVDDVDHIDSIRVHFYGMRCPEGITAPDNAEKRLPLGCTGYVSATPKRKDNTDVPPIIHGPDVAWELFQGEGEDLARVSEFPGQPFNRIVEPRNEGYFTMCATVKTVRGCFGFHIYRP